MTNNLFSLVVVAGLLLGSLSSAAGQDYEARLFRPLKVGDKFRLIAKGHNVESMGVFVEGQPVQQKADETTIAMVATVTALEVDGRGKPTKYSVEIEKWDLKSVVQIPSMLRPGAVVVAELQGQRYLSKVNDMALDPLSSKVLSLVVPWEYSGVTDDDVFGTNERKRVGDSWLVNSEVAARSLGESVGVNVDRSDVSGTATLDGVVKDGSADYLVISATLRIDKFSIPLPDGLRIQNGQMVGNFFGRFPKDAGRLPLNQSGKLAGQFSGLRPAGINTPEIAFKGSIERSVSREFQELK